MNTESQSSFEGWSASVKDCGHEVQPNSATARQRNLGWQASRDHIIAKLQSPEMVERVAVAIAKASGINDWFKAANEYEAEAKAAIAAVFEGV